MSASYVQFQGYELQLIFEIAFPMASICFNNLYLHLVKINLKNGYCVLSHTLTLTEIFKNIMVVLYLSLGSTENCVVQ